jgi:hypothetical protein
MKTYLAKWPNGTISILQAKTLVDLFWDLDAEADPAEAKVFELPKRFHLATCIVNNEIQVDEMHCEICDSYNIKEVFFPDTIIKDAYTANSLDKV